MSAFFDWDIQPVKQALLDEINRKRLPTEDISNLACGQESEWNMVTIKLDEYSDKEYYTNTWDVEFYHEEQGNGSTLYSITAYPMYADDQGCFESAYCTWITLHEQLLRGAE
jgi:hypothetical protein